MSLIERTKLILNNMNNPYLFSKTILFILLTALFAACTSDDIDISQLHQPVTMRLVGGLKAFDDSTTTRTATWTWADGATVYLQFKNGSKTVSTRAIYTQATDDWTMPDLSSVISTSGQCEVYYFDGTSSTPLSGVTLGSDIGVYADQSGNYTYADGMITVSATLAPLTSRVRFVKPSGTDISTVSVEGIHFYTAYNAGTNTFTTSDDVITSTINTSTGYTSYIYGTYTDVSNRELTLTNSTDGNDIIFTRSFGANVFQTGKSGTLTIPTKENSKNWTVTDNSKVEIEAVDLGLPSGVKWANMNVGAERPEDYGLYFAWGETTGYTSDINDGRSFSWASYKWMIEGKSSLLWVNKYQIADGKTSGCWYDSSGQFIGDNLTILLPEDDAATQNWGANWRMPTIVEIQELLDNTTYNWTTRNGVKGGLFTSKVNGNSIFIPAAGRRGGGSLYYQQDARGFCWSSSLDTSYTYYAQNLYFTMFDAFVNYYNDRDGRYYGESVRPVQDPEVIPGENDNTPPNSKK